MNAPKLVLALLLATLPIPFVEAQQIGQSSPSESPPAVEQPEAEDTQQQQLESQEAIEGLEEEVAGLKRRVEALGSGNTKFLITGYAFSGYSDRDAEPSTFSAGFNPIFLWRLSDRVFFEGEPEVELEGDETVVELEYADVSFIINGYATATAGLFLTPVGAFGERLHPAWINKLPDAPLPFGHDGLVPTASLGIQLHGGFNAGRTKFKYATFLVNGPRLVTPEEDEETAGMLDFDNFDDNNDNKAFGGRLGFLPIPQLELGYSFLSGKAGGKGSEFQDVGAFISAFDLSYTRSSPILKGNIDLRAEWIFSEVDQAHELEFKNERDGGYFQFAYRPSNVQQHFLRNAEGVVRFDSLNLPAEAPENIDTDRWTFGVNYWINASTVLKFAYQSTDRTIPEVNASTLSEGSEEEGEARGNPKAFLIQCAIGF